LIEAAVPDIPAYWAEAGRPGWNPDLPLGAAPPWSYAGLVIGAWQLDEPLAPQLPFPGVLQTQAVPSWFDTLSMGAGDPARDGFDAGLARASVSRTRPAPGDKTSPKTVADLLAAGGSAAYEHNALWLRRGDQATWIEAGALDWRSGGFGALEPAGRHLFGGTVGWTRGRHHLEGAFNQRGSAGALASGEQQTGTGASGFGTYSYEIGGGRAAVSGGEAYTHHESTDENFFNSRRDARAGWASASWSDSNWAVHALGRTQRVARVVDVFGETRWSSPEVWGGAEATRTRGAFRLRAGVAGGHDNATGQTVFTATATVTYRKKGVLANLWAGRYAAPVWSDLAEGQAPFLQRTWSGGADLAFLHPQGWSARAAWQMGRTTERAIATRLPLEDLWLRAGLRADPAGYDFGLATGGVGWTNHHFAAGAEGFALIHQRSAAQANVDPLHGGTAYGEGSFRVFAGDLEVKLRAEVDATGARESDEAFPVTLPGYVTTGVTAIGQLSDATVTFRVMNLEDERHEEVWIDSSTGLPAVGTGREFRLSLAWRFFN
jgi:hypothetical protein